MSEDKKVKLLYKVPKNKVDAILLLNKVRKERQALAKKTEEARSQEGMIETRVLELFKKEELDGLRAKGVLASIKRSDVPVIENDKEFYAHIKKTGEFDLLERRPAKEACRARWKDGKKVPGVGIFTKVGINLTSK